MSLYNGDISAGFEELNKKAFSPFQYLRNAMKNVLGTAFWWLKNLTTRRKSRKALYQYWKEPDDGKNLPQSYAKTDEKKLGKSRAMRSRFLVELIKRYAAHDSKILEIGCNVGRNLNYLFSAGFTKLNGIEISENAVRLIEKIYPEMARKINIINRPVEDVVRNFHDNEFDIVFTMAVLEHIHPESRFIFPEISRITRRYLITIEDEKYISERHFPRNYKRIFESFGMEQVYASNMVSGLSHNFRARIFKKQRSL